jgi:membrane dipeptidase
MKYFDLHCDTVTDCFEKGSDLYSNGLGFSIKKASVYKPWAQVFAIWIPDEFRNEKAVARFDGMYGVFIEQMRKNRETTEFCGNWADMERALSHNRNIALLAIEGGGALGGRIENLGRAYERGVRILTLTWNGTCELADGCIVKNAGGLIEFGLKVVREMGSLGMVVDVSHLSEKGFWEVADYGRPFIASHSNSKEICDVPRNLTDNQFKAVVKTGGLVGLNFYPDFIGGQKRLNDLLPHIERFLALGGEKTLALGTDIDGAMMPPEITGVGDVAKLHHLIRRRFGGKIADRIFFENAFSFFKTALTGCASCTNIDK